MGPEATASHALAAALTAVGKDAQAEAMLRDIRPEELSFVDRAANRRQFLLVKRGSGGTTMGDLKLQQTLRDETLRKLSDPLSRLAEAATKVKSAEVAEGDEGAALPSDLTGEVTAAAAELQKAFGGEPDALEKALGKLDADTRKAVAEQPVQKMPELVDGMSETADKMRVLGAVMMALGDAESPEQVQAIHDKVAEVLGGGGGAGDAPEPGDAADPDKAAASGGQPQPAQAAGQQPGADALSKLTATLDQLATKVDEIDKRTKGSGEPEPQPTHKGSGQGEPTNQEVLKKIDALTEKVQKLEDTPQTPASRSEPSGSAPRQNGRSTRGTRYVL